MTLLRVAVLVQLLSIVCQARATHLEFKRDVRPILTKYCFQCHAESVRMGNLDLRTPESMLQGGTKGPALVKGSAVESLFYQRIVDKSMPMGDTKVSAAIPGLCDRFV